MNKVDKHGLTIRNLRKVCGELKYHASGHYSEIFYDRATGELFAVYHVSCQCYTVCDYPDIIRICGTSSPMTMQALADEVAMGMAKEKRKEEYYAELEREGQRIREEWEKRKEEYSAECERLYEDGAL